NTHLVARQSLDGGLDGLLARASRELFRRPHPRVRLRGKLVLRLELLAAAGRRYYLSVTSCSPQYISHQRSTEWTRTKLFLLHLVKAILASTSTCASIAWRNTDKSNDSFGECALVSGSSTPVSRILALGKASTRSATNGIDPPSPVSIAAVPHASDSACFIMSVARTFGSTTNGRPTSPGCTWTSAPWTSRAPMWRLTACIASCGSIPGPSRIEKRAFAVGTMALADSGIGVASIPMILRAALFQSRSARFPVPASL